MIDVFYINADVTERSMTVKNTIWLICILSLVSPIVAAAEQSEDLDYAQVIMVSARQQENGLWRFDVTLRHNDEGWDHYADAWQVVRPDDGEVLGERILAHPHEHEQPFTRSLSAVSIPRGLTVVVIRAKCNVHGFGGREVRVDLKRRKGDRFEVVPLKK
jgi:hypothetical protein